MSSPTTRLLARFQQAIALHQKGQLEHARAIYEEILQLEPGHFDALHLLGVIAGQTQNPRRAVELIGKAISIDSRDAGAHCNLGSALKDLKHWDAALASYDQSIALRPDFAEAYSNRGIVLRELGQLEAALKSCNEAIAIKRGLAEAYSNRGIVLRELGQLEAALASYDQAIALNPNLAEAHCNRGDVLKELKQWDAALASCNRAIAIRRDYAEAHYNRGIVQKELERWGAALISYDQAITLKADYAEAYCSRGIVLTELNRLDEALASCNRALEIQPRFAEAYSCRGTVLRKLNRFDDSLASYDRAIAIKPDFAEAYSNRGAALQELNRLDEALASYDRAIDLEGGHAEAYSNRGIVLQALGELDAALASFDRAIALKGDFTAAHLNRSLALLLTGDFTNGWIEYEWRRKIEQSSSSYEKRNLPQALWRGDESLAGKTILLHSEQGLGDTIQFCRYVKLVADLGATVIFQVPRVLSNLLATLDGAAKLVVEGEAVPAFDRFCPLLSLPLAFKTALSSIPAQIPYLRASAEKNCEWKIRLGEKRKLRVGLVWSGGFRPNQPQPWGLNHRRNIPLAQLAPLKHPDIDFYSLQKGQPAESELAQLMSVHWDGPQLIDWTRELEDFADTAALMENLDLVISVDTCTAHLAGALGKPVWILNRFYTCWRWLLDRDDSPWYPTARLYRQKSPQDWQGVVESVRADLLRLMSAAGRTAEG